jgi:hypothetical protein
VAIAEDLGARLRGDDRFSIDVQHRDVERMPARA